MVTVGIGAVVLLLLVLRFRPQSHGAMRGAPSGPLVLRAVVWAQGAWYGLAALVLLAVWSERRPRLPGVPGPPATLEVALTVCVVLALLGAGLGARIRRGNGALPFYVYETMATAATAWSAVLNPELSTELLLNVVGWVFLLRADTRAFLAPPPLDAGSSPAATT